MPDETPASQLSGHTTEPAPAGSALLLPGNEDSNGSPAHPEAKPFPESSLLAGLPMQLDVMIPVPSFRVQDLLALEKGGLLESRWPPSDDVPVWCGGSQLVWSEFEVVDQKLAVRVTRLG
ncbi:MAG: FliM/FliN family flagellar motor C-terminal domain-containing protein [Acidobacteriaceae bacterium]